MAQLPDLYGGFCDYANLMNYISAFLNPAFNA